jgi:hypothetical protein
LDANRHLDDSSLLIEREAAVAIDRAQQAPGGGPDPRPDTPPTPPELPPGAGPSPTPSSPLQPSAEKTFYGSISLNPISAKMDFATIMDEVVQQFTSQVGVEVSISVEIQASKPSGFDENVQRAVRENCSVLKFTSSEFE